MNDFETARQCFLDGLQLFAANNFQAAEIQFARSFELLPQRVSTLNNLSAVKIKLKKFAEAGEFARQAIALEENSAEAWSNLGIALTGLQRHDEALPAYDRALKGNSAYVGAWLGRATTLLELKRFEEALPACDQALQLEPGNHAALYAKSLILKELNRPAEAQKTYWQSLDMRVASSPVFIAERRGTQKGDILIISQNPAVDDSLKSFEALHLLCPNFPGQLAQRFQEDFHFTSVFAGDAVRPSARSRIPQPDLVINNHANGELIHSKGGLPEMTALFDSFGVPVVNHPAKAVQTARDTSARLVENIPGVLVPKTLRFSSAGKTREALVEEIEAQYDYPLITRHLAAQEGKGMTKVDSRQALVAGLAAGLPEKFFVTQFVDGRGGKKFFRKIRAAVVGDEIILVRVDFDTYWNVRGRKSEKRVPFYLENPQVIEEEKQICRNPEAELGRCAIESLQAVRGRIPLDVFGMDFDVGADGRLIFYEANATMNLLTTANKAVPNPQEADDRLKLAFQRYLASLVVRR